MTDEPRPEELTQVAFDAFNVFGFDVDAWPDIVQINRSGYTDVNIRGIWTFEDRIEFFNAPLPELIRQPTLPYPTSPESSGSSD